MGYHDYWKDTWSNYSKSKRSSREIGDGSHDTSVKRSSFLFEDDYQWDDDRWSGKSLSSSGKYFGYYGSDSKLLNSENDMLNEAACKTVRLLNSVTNSADGNEKVLTIKWASNDANADASSARSTDILLSPDKVIEMKACPEICDAIGGKALMMATLKRTSDHTSRNVAIGVSARMKIEPDKVTPYESLALPIYEGIESSIAKQDLLQNWPGSVGYVYRNQAVSCASKEQVEKYITDNGDCAESAVAALSWILNNPSTPITLSPAIDDALSEVLTTMIPGVGRFNRWKTAKECAEHIIKKLPPKSNPQPPPNGGGGGDGDGSSGKAPPIPNSSDSEATLCERSSSYSRSQLPDGISTKDDLEKFDKPKIPDGCSVCSKTHFERIGRNVFDENDTLSGVKHGTPIKLAYNIIAKSVSNLTKGIVESMQFRASERAFDVYGTSSGDLDEGNLHKIAQRRISDPFIHRRTEMVAFPNVLVGILVDMSGSMSGRKIAESRRMAIAFREAFKRLKGVDCYISGHRHGNTDGDVSVYELYDKDNPSIDESEIAKLDSGGSNADGYALEMVLKKLGKKTGYAHKVMILISDGLPAARGDDGRPYGDLPAMKHIKNVCDWGLRKYRIRTIGIGICDAYSDTAGKIMFGEGNFATIPDTIGSIPVIKRFLSGVTAKMM